MPSSGALPPSVEKAYYRKCIELRRRITEIEEHNDATRLRIKRLNRSVLKMRLERAFLLEQLQQRMDYNVDQSDNSTSPPPTPQDKPLRSKRSHRKTTPTGAPPSSQHGAASPPPSSSHPHSHALAPHGVPMSSAQTTPDPQAGPSGRMLSDAFYPPSAEASYTSGMNGAGAGRPLAPAGPYEQSPAVPRGSFDERRSVSTSHENGADRDYAGRAYAPGATGEPLGSGSEIRTDANGERRIARDEEMADAAEASRDSGASAGGFTAVNR